MSLVTAAVVLTLALSELAQGQEAEKAERPNETGVIVAGTWEHEGDKFFTLGSEYERRLTPRFGMVGEVEHLFDANRWIVVAPLVFHATRGIKLFGGPGFERADAEVEEVGAEPAVEPPERETNFLLRVGAAYAPEFAGRYSIGPTVSLDFIRGNGEWKRAVVFGLSFGVSF